MTALIENKTQKIQSMTPKEIVAELDKYIIGQDEAKKSVAIALRNRYRRSLLSEEMREEITPKNILKLFYQEPIFVISPRKQDLSQVHGLLR